MNSGELSLADTIRSAIAFQGPVPFAWFMEQALYHPHGGYYASGKAAIGRGGDFFTNVSVGSLFGELMACQFVEMWERLGRPQPFVLVEQGAHHGHFARDVLNFLTRENSALLGVLHYIIIEPLDALRDLQREQLHACYPVQWHDSLSALNPFVGVHFSNELIDAMPLHLLEWSGNQWHEKHVTWSDGRFAFVNRPLSSPLLEIAAETLGTPSIQPFQVEVNLAMVRWIEQLASKLERGYVLTVDYGLTREERLRPERAGGTVSCYSHHQRLSDPLQNAGSIDITAQVDFSGLIDHARALGLHLAGFVDQHRALAGLAAIHFSDAASLDEAEQKKRRQFTALMHPEMMGRAFHFLAFAKGVSDTRTLSSFRFAPGPGEAPA